MAIRTPAWRRSSIAASENPRSANFEALYADPPAKALTPASEAMFTMKPPPPFFMIGAA